MQTVRGSDSIDIRNSPQANNSNAVQSEEKAKKAEDQPTKPDHNAHHAPDHGYASSERGFGQPKHHAAGPGPNRQAGRKPNAEKPKAARSPIEQEPSVSVRLKGGASQSEGYSVSSYGTARPDRRSVNRWGREKCIGCMEKLTRNPFRFTKVGRFIQTILLPPLSLSLCLYLLIFSLILTNLHWPVRILSKCYPNTDY